MKIEYNEFEWHDAKIKQISLLTQEDAFDRFYIKMESGNFVKTYGMAEVTMLISDCYKIRIDMNLWIQGFESISEFNIRKDGVWINEERKRFCNGFGPEEIAHFEIITNSNSKIEALITKMDSFELIL